MYWHTGMSEVLARHRGGIGIWENLAEKGGPRTEHRLANIAASVWTAAAYLLWTAAEYRGAPLWRALGRSRAGARVEQRPEQGWNMQQYVANCLQRYTVREPTSADAGDG